MVSDDLHGYRWQAGNHAKKGDEPMSETKPVWSCVTISRTAIKRDGELMAIADSWLTATELLDAIRASRPAPCGWDGPHYCDCHKILQGEADE